MVLNIYFCLLMQFWQSMIDFHSPIWGLETCLCEVFSFSGSSEQGGWGTLAPQFMQNFCKIPLLPQILAVLCLQPPHFSVSPRNSKFTPRSCFSVKILPWLGSVGVKWVSIFTCIINHYSLPTWHGAYGPCHVKWYKTLTTLDKLTMFPCFWPEMASTSTSNTAFRDSVSYGNHWVVVSVWRADNRRDLFQSELFWRVMFMKIRWSKVLNFDSLQSQISSNTWLYVSKW